MPSQKNENFAKVVGEWLFGITGTPITTADISVDLIAHEAYMYMLGYSLGHTTFNVRNSQNNVVQLNRTQMETLLNAIHAALEARHVVFAGKKDDVDAGRPVDEKTGWPRRNAILEEIDNEKVPVT